MYPMLLYQSGRMDMDFRTSSYVEDALKVRGYLLDSAADAETIS